MTQKTERVLRIVNLAIRVFAFTLGIVVAGYSYVCR
jgi:hypothetical protein